MRRALPAARGVALVALIAAACCAIELWVLLPLRCANRATTGGALLDRDDRRSDERTRRIARRIRAQLKECDCVRNVVAIPFTLGAAAEVTGDAATAIAEYRRALAIDRRPELYFRLGMAQLQSFENAEAVENFTRACAFRPALLAEIPYDETRAQVQARLVAAYGTDWIR